MNIIFAFVFIAFIAATIYGLGLFKPWKPSINDDKGLALKLQSLNH